MSIQAYTTIVCILLLVFISIHWTSYCIYTFKNTSRESFVDSPDYAWKYYYNRPDSTEKVVVDDGVSWIEKSFR